MKLLKFLDGKLLKLLNCLSLKLVARSANSACVWYFHQPEFPEEANKFKKI